VSDTASLFFDGGALFSNAREDINAAHVLSNGHIVLSTVGNARLGGLTFGDDDLVDYDPVSDTASLFFDGGALFSNAREDINAAHVLSNGHIVLSRISTRPALTGVMFSPAGRATTGSMAALEATRWTPAPGRTLWFGMPRIE
jgi:hypothetical protein